mgnify:FL=1
MPLTSTSICAACSAQNCEPCSTCTALYSAAGAGCQSAVACAGSQLWLVCVLCAAGGDSQGMDMDPQAPAADQDAVDEGEVWHDSTEHADWLAAYAEDEEVEDAAVYHGDDRDAAAAFADICRMFDSLCPNGHLTETAKAALQAQFGVSMTQFFAASAITGWRCTGAGRPLAALSRLALTAACALSLMAQQQMYLPCRPSLWCLLTRCPYLYVAVDMLLFLQDVLLLAEKAQP